MQNITLDAMIWGLFLSLFAGLATGIGGAIAFITKKTNTRLLAAALGFSAGVMIYVSFMEIIPEAHHALAKTGSKSRADWIVFFAFMGGILLIAVIDWLIPEQKNPHEMNYLETGLDEQKKHPNLMRMGIFTSLAIAIHNFPEGIATFAASLQNSGVGISIALAVAIHNIPEGIAVAMPIYFATGSRKKAFFLSLSSGIAEPFGALLSAVLLYQFFSPELMAIFLAGVAGIMVFISMDELLPSAEKFGEHHISVYSMIAGMAVMGISLNLL